MTLTGKPDDKLETLVKHCQKILSQKRQDTHKVYSVHAPEVECIAKGKAHRRYEFGCKVGVVSTSKGNWILDVEALHGNPYDGHTLKDSLMRAEEMSGCKIETASVDKGFRGAQRDVTDVNVIYSGSRHLNRKMKRLMRRRAAIEPVIGHAKSDHRMDRNHLKGENGDQINAILAGCGFNLNKLFGALLHIIFLLTAKAWVAANWAPKERGSAADLRGGENRESFGLVADRTHAILC